MPAFFRGWILSIIGPLNTKWLMEFVEKEMEGGRKKGKGNKRRGREGKGREELEEEAEEGANNRGKREKNGTK